MSLGYFVYRGIRKAPLSLGVVELSIPFGNVNYVHKVEGGDVRPFLDILDDVLRQ